MMLITKEVVVKWNAFTRKHYEEKGYVFTNYRDEFICKIEDLQATSATQVDVECQYKKEGCKGIYKKQYRDYIRIINNGEKVCCSCPNCTTEKRRENNLIKYGVEEVRSLKHLRDASSEKLRTPFQEVVDFCKNKGLIVISKKEDYKNDRSILQVICENHKQHGVQNTCFANIKKNKGCCGYSKAENTAKQLRLDVNTVKQRFVELGLTPMFDEEDYLNNMSNLAFICPEHKDKGLQYKRYGNLSNNKHLCEYCAIESTKNLLKTDQTVVFEYFKTRGLQVCSDQVYKNKETHIKCNCVIHNDNVVTITFSSLKNTSVPCDLCRLENDIRDLSKRIRSGLYVWKKQSEDSCNNSCVLTGVSERYEIHHLKSLSSIIREVCEKLEIIDISNISAEEYVKVKQLVDELHLRYGLGVCLNQKLHILFHQIYGKVVEPEQFEEFKIRLSNGEFDDFLEENDLKLKL